MEPRVGGGTAEMVRGMGWKLTVEGMMVGVGFRGGCGAVVVVAVAAVVVVGQVGLLLRVVVVGLVVGR